MEDVHGTAGSDNVTMLPANSRVKIISNDSKMEDTLQTLKSSRAPAVINYGASWCRICSQILPTFFQLSNEFPNISFIYADIDECPETTQNIRYTPTFRFFRDGERVDEMYGAAIKEADRLHEPTREDIRNLVKSSEYKHNIAC